MEVMKIIVTIAITMAITITLTMRSISNNVEEKPPYKQLDISNTIAKNSPLPSKRFSRFLAEDGYRNPRADDHCHKDHEVCTQQGGYNSASTICCNNKCVDLHEDRDNCGACKKKCKYTETCCKGECVYLAYDKRHCGRCNNRCKHGKYCVYGLCDYA